MRHFATILLAGILSFSAARGTTLREQLALAEEANDTHARIEIIRRILDKEPDDALSGPLVNLWLAPAYILRALAEQCYFPYMLPNPFA